MAAVPVVPLVPVVPSVLLTYDPRGDADLIHNAIAGLGTNDKQLIAVLSNKTPLQLAALRTFWQTDYKRDLVEDLKGEASFNYKTALTYFVGNPAEVKADYMFDAMDGIGTKDRALIDVISGTSNAVIQEMKPIYAQKYHGKKGKKDKKDKKEKEGSVAAVNTLALEEDVKSETSGNFQRILLECLKGLRNELVTNVNEADARRDAEALYNAGEKRWGTDDTLFIEVLAHRSPIQIALVNRFYTESHKHSLLEAIKSETSGDYQDALLALATPPAEYAASRMHGAMKGLGTNDLVLIYHVCTQFPMQPIREAYQRMYGKSLESDIEGDTSGDYKNFLLSIVRNRP
eukprot:TRINITY_DN685_c0_g3_i1.p1 TRINITY_DN685_c0_g3~~TRINITY_DN685_c0_g3_i1.p1  ORF type:complete len:345 (-),score=100.55 TRINITY_DN685_c0_g3_i1:57-1091(-)